MPYVHPAIRTPLTPVSDRAAGISGELNYQLTYLVNQYLYRRGEEFPPCYSDINEVIGVLECAKMELYRRIAAPHEDEKSMENGDVYGPDQKSL